MNLEKLLEQHLLKRIEPVSLDQIHKRLASALTYFKAAERLFENRGKNDALNQVVYTNLYNAMRLCGETLLLLHGYKAAIDQHHKTVIQAARLLISDPEMETVFARFDKMRKTRNTIDYDLDALDVSDQTLKQAMLDVRQFTNQLEKIIHQKDKQQKLNF